MNQSLAQYISTWLAPSEYQLELKNRLDNLCALSGIPMSPGLHQWVTDKFGLEMTRVIEDYSTFTSPKLSPELLSVVDRIVPTNYQGEDVNLSFRQLFDVGCAPPACKYCLNFFAYPDVAGYPSYYFQSFYMDSAATIPAFSPVISDAINGEGGLRALLQSMGGDVAGLYENPTFVWNYLLYYNGPPMSIPLYDSLGNVAYTLDFLKFEDYGYPCTNNNNYCVQFPNIYDVLWRFNASGGPFGIIDFYWPATTSDIYPYGAVYLNLTDPIEMNKFIKMLYGPSAGYTLVDDGVNYTFTITNALFYGLPRIMPAKSSGGVSYGDLDMNLC